MFTSRKSKTGSAEGWLVSPRQRAGAAAEQRALDHLQAHGLRLVERNYRAAFAALGAAAASRAANGALGGAVKGGGQGRGRAAGEIDLVMRDGATLVFVEVRWRSSASHGGAGASITAAKQAKLVRAAQFYLQERLAGRPMPDCRFDVVVIDGDRLEWLPAAFDAGA